MNRRIIKYIFSFSTCNKFYKPSTFLSLSLSPLLKSFIQIHTIACVCYAFLYNFHFSLYFSFIVDASTAEVNIFFTELQYLLQIIFCFSILHRSLKSFKIEIVVVNMKFSGIKISLINFNGNSLRTFLDNKSLIISHSLPHNYIIMVRKRVIGIFF